MAYRFLVFIFPVLFMGCEKGESSDVTITGTLLQSSSHPVPVSGYKLHFQQAGSGAEIPVGTNYASGSSADAVTSPEGYFECHFSLGKSSILGIPTGTNSNLIYVSADQNTGVQIRWSGLYAANRNLNTVYLYKKISRAIVQVASSNGINPADTLYVSASTVSGAYQKAITGLTIAAGSNAVVIDTIPDIIFTSYSFRTEQYENSLYISKSKFGPFAGAVGFETGADENEKTYTINL